jgi:hypothetical protein
MRKIMATLLLLSLAISRIETRAEAGMLVKHTKVLDRLYVVSPQLVALVLSTAADVYSKLRTDAICLPNPSKACRLFSK